MKKLQITAALLAALVNSASGDISIDDLAPVGAIAQSTAFGATGSRIFDEDDNANHARGNRFVLPAGPGSAYQIESITIVANGSQAYVDDTLTLHIYQGTTEQFDAGDGHSTPEDGSDYYVNTEVTPLESESFVFSGTPTAGQYVTIALTTPIEVDEASDYGFFLTFDQGSGTNTNFFYRESGAPADPNDGRTSITTTNHGTAASRQMNYYVNGSVIGGLTPPTITASAQVVEVGNSVDLNITFDIGADTATVTTSTGIIDLKGIDAGDDVPGDGIVIVSDSPTSSFTYQVLVQAAGEDDGTASATVSVEAPDNAFSTLIKADEPLFYYRFEEEMGADFLLDSSGNDHHTGDIVGSFEQGSSPGGMQNAGNFPGDVGIQSPATSAHEQSFTVTAVINADDAQSNQMNIFSMTDGGGIGRSIIYMNAGNFETFMDGSAQVIAPASNLPDRTSCLLHMVYDAADLELRVYLDGVNQGSLTLGGVPANSGNWVLGSHKGRTFSFYRGWIDETAVFESELTDEQILAHATAFLDAADPILGFVSDVTDLVAAGDPAILTWKTSDQASVVTLNGNSVDGGDATGGGIYTMTVNPTTTTTYTLDVDGETREITITVPGIPEPPTITSVSANSATPPDITIEIQGDPSSTYNIQGSSILTDGFPNFKGTIDTDELGFGTATFEGVGERELYRTEAQ